MAKADYLAKYYAAGVINRRVNETKKKKTRRRKESQPSHISVVDEDVGWPASETGPLPPAKPRDGEESDDGPVVENAAEVHHQLQLLQGQAQFSSHWESEEVPAQSLRPHGFDDDSPPRRRARHDSDDEIPQQRIPTGHGSGQQQKPRARNDSVSCSPPRRSDGGQGATSPSHHQVAVTRPVSTISPRQTSFNDAAVNSHQGIGSSHRHDSDDDSPPRRYRAQPRTARHDPNDESPPRRLQADAARDAQNRYQGGIGTSQRPAGAQSPWKDSDDESPPRRQCASGPDLETRIPGARLALPKEEAGLSGIRQGGDDHRSTSGRYEQRDTQGHDKGVAGSRLGKTSAATGGLVESHEMAKQLQQKKLHDRQRILEMDASQSGRGAASTFRLDGKIVSKEQYEEGMTAKQTKRHPKYLEEDVEWKGGLAQRRAVEEQQHALAREGRKRFQREFDEDADANMQQELRMDDPMAKYFATKQRTLGACAEGELIDAHAAELASASGFIIPQAIPAHSWIKRGVQPLPNRHKIKPGRHWDGVSRGNGFEQKFVFQYQHNRAERERDRYVLAEDL